MEGKLGAAKLSLFVNLGLLASKIAAAFITGSIGLYAESAHSLFDLFASVLAYLGIRKADEPEDETHHYGHEKFETLSSMLQALLITGTAFVIAFEAWQKLSSPGKVEMSEIGIGLMLLSIPIAYLTSKKLNDSAKQAGGSQALEADSAHFTTDIISSVAVLAGLILVRFGYAAGDPLSAFVVALVMLYISFELLSKSFIVFMDFSPDQATMNLIDGVLVTDGRITRFHKLRARYAGSKILVDVHIHVPHHTGIKQAHAIAHEVKEKIMKAVPAVKEVNIHIEPD
jgi:cation diffusion facilitator family transporter